MGRALGLAGEDFAARHLEQAGLRIVVRNWRCREGEIDLVAVDPRAGDVVICEVKTRRSNFWGDPSEAVDWRKQARLRRLAGRFLATDGRGLAPGCRFDVVEVLVRGGVAECRHLRDAF